MSLALVPDLRCSGCNAGVDPTEEGLCSFCRMQQRGDDLLVCHDDRGWLGEDGERVPCR
jgi:predicted amidophosphoribosyltransferase